MELDITDLEHNLSFYPGCGSPKGTMRIDVISEGKNITEYVFSTEPETFGTIDVQALKRYVKPVINVYYTHPDGEGSVTYNIVSDHPCNFGHSLGEWYLHKVPTTSEAGEERRDCANCDYYESKEIAAYRYGDLNRDGKVNTIDANYARRYAAGLLTLDEGQKLAGDVNLDGEVNVIDSAIIRRFVLKYITSLPHKETV